ncbi:MAG: acetyl-CoA hydrolase/transferase family protein [Planctomycetaceae bacterium]|nr:acetyl-CoA hydrolase/transferase family protein [Planctomycetaceae bacterium]
MNWKERTVTVEEAVAHLRSETTIFVQGCAATPQTLLDGIVARKDLTGMRLAHMHLEGDLKFVRPENSSRFRSLSLFADAALRGPIAEGRADFVPVFLSDIPRLFEDGTVPLDAALIQVSPPDRHGLCSLGTSVDSARAAVDHARIVLAEVNDQMPRTHGHTAVPWDRITAAVQSSRPLPEHPPEPESDVESRIGDLIAELVEDRSCLQLGIGGIPNAVLNRLGNKHDLGIHTEMFSDGVVDLTRKGVITNRFKSIHPGRTVTSFVLGSRKLYDFVDDNPLVEFHPCDRTNDTQLIRKIDRMVSINSALQIDLTGQVCADSIGHRIYSGIGGQMDFMRGAAVSREGKPIIALPSTASHGKISRIVPELLPGAGVVTTRGHVHWIVTEFGKVNLHGRSLRERGELLVSISHPDFRGELTEHLKQLKRFV